MSRRHAEPIEAYRDLPIFDGLSKGEVREIFERGRFVHIPSDWSMIVESSPPDNAYLLLEGRVRVHLHRHQVAELGAGDLVGELGLVSPRLRTATVTALEPLSALVFPAADFTAVRQAVPRFAERVDAVVAERLDEADRKHEHEQVDTVVLDVDGTLVDTVYQHTMCWISAFSAVDVDVPAYRLHRAIGMGGDRLVAEVAGKDVDEKYGDQVREHHDTMFDGMIADVRPLPGAADLLVELRRRGLKLVVATSGLPDQTERLLAHVGGIDKVDETTTSSEVENSKPAPDVVSAAVEKVGGRLGAMLGDAVWDVRAAKDAGHVAVALLSGGFGEAELRDAGASEVFPTPRELLEALDRTPLRGRP
jgi:phosphoglycolate phosphatase-like HAD superfamily hydrolase